MVPGWRARLGTSGFVERELVLLRRFQLEGDGGILRGRVKTQVSRVRLRRVGCYE